jgi:adenine-specific DNA-methyltransferase
VQNVKREVNGAPAKGPMRLRKRYHPDNDATLYLGDRLRLLRQIPDGAAQLVVTSPPYNIGKQYEDRQTLEEYLAGQEETLTECARILDERGSLCWQVGNHIARDGEVVPLDMLIWPICRKLGLVLRNRIVWHFEHGLHCKRRFSGRYETILWLTRSRDHIFHLDPVRVPQKYPGKKHFKGEKRGEYSGNPKGKNPGDVWILPNVKHNHCEKSGHPCQFPVELIARLVLSMTDRGGLVVDPYMGVGSALCAAVMHGRRAAGADTVEEYVETARQRVRDAFRGTLRVRPMGRPVYEPTATTAVARNPWGNGAE